MVRCFLLGVAVLIAGCGGHHIIETVIDAGPPDAGHTWLIGEDCGTYPFTVCAALAPNGDAGIASACDGNHAALRAVMDCGLGCGSSTFCAYGDPCFPSESYAISSCRRWRPDAGKSETVWVAELGAPCGRSFLDYRACVDMDGGAAICDGAIWVAEPPINDYPHCYP